MGGALGPAITSHLIQFIFLSPPPEARSSPSHAAPLHFGGRDNSVQPTMPKICIHSLPEKICSGLLRSYIAVKPIRIVEFYKLNTV